MGGVRGASDRSPLAAGPKRTANPPRAVSAARSLRDSRPSRPARAYGLASPCRPFQRTRNRARARAADTPRKTPAVASCPARRRRFSPASRAVNDHADPSSRACRSKIDADVFARNHTAASRDNDVAAGGCGTPVAISGSPKTAGTRERVRPRPVFRRPDTVQPAPPC